MREKGGVRDWEVLEAISSLGEDSFDAVFRDVNIEDGTKADFLRYRSQNYIVECRFYHDGTDMDCSTAMNDLRDAREVLDEETFKPRLRLSNIDSMNPGYNPELDGDYFIDTKSNIDEIYTVLGDVLSDDLDELTEIKCKR